MMNTTNTGDYERGFFDVFFTSIGVFVTSLVASFTMVGIMMGQPRSNWKNKEDESDEEDELPFIQRFYEEFNELEEKVLDDDEKKKLLKTFLEMETDKSEKVIMRWNNDRNSFDFWSENKNVTYLELDACAQKYAIDNDCKSLVVNYKQEYDDAVKAWIKENKPEEYEGAEKDTESDCDSDEDESSEEDDSMPEVNVFATFKNYKEEPINKHNSDKPLITTKKSNQFRHVGSITDYENEFVKKEDEKSKSDEEKKSMTFNEWKKNKEEEEKKKDK